MNTLGFSSVVHVAGSVDGCWQLTDLYFKSFLDVIKHFLVLLSLDKRDCETLSAEPSCSADSVQITVGFGWHVEVENDVNLLNVDTTTEDLGCNKDAVLELLEALVDFDSDKINTFLLLTFLPREFLCESPYLGWCFYLKFQLTSGRRQLT